MIDKRKGKLLPGPFLAVVAFALLLGILAWVLASGYLGGNMRQKLGAAQDAVDVFSRTLGFSLRANADTFSYFVSENAPSFVFLKGERVSSKPLFERSGKFSLSSRPGVEFQWSVAAPFPIPADFSGSQIEGVVSKAAAPFPGLVSVRIYSVSGLEWSAWEVGSHAEEVDIPAASPLSHRNSNAWVVESGRSGICALYSIPWRAQGPGGGAGDSGSARIMTRMSADLGSVRKAVSLDNLTIFSLRSDFFFFSADAASTGLDISSLRPLALGLPEFGTRTTEANGTTFLIGHFPYSDLVIASEADFPSYWWLAIAVAIVAFLAFLSLGILLQKTLQAQIGGKEERVYIENWFEETTLVVGGMLEQHGIIPQRPASDSLTDRAGALLHDFRSLLARLDILLQAESQKTREFSSFLEAADSSLVDLSPDGKITAASKQFAHLLEVPVDWLVGRDFASLVSGSQGQERFHREWEYLMQGSKVSFEVKLAVEDREPVMAMIAAVPLNPRGGSCSGVLVLTTDRRKFYLSRRSEHFRDRLLEMSRLAAEIAHNFNNALCAILGSISLLEMRLKKVDPSLVEGTVGENILMIRRAADKSTQLARQLMRLTPRTDDTSGESDAAQVLGDALRTVPAEWGVSIASRPKAGIRVPLSRYSLQGLIVESVRRIASRISTGTKLLVRLGEVPRRITPLGDTTPVGCSDVVAILEVYPLSSEASGSPGDTGEELSGSLPWLEAQRAVFDSGGAIVENSETLPLPNLVAYVPVLSGDRKQVLPDSHQALSVLVVDDEETVCETIASFLREIGDSVTVVRDSAGLDRALCLQKYDAIVVDLSFERMGIDDLLQKVRSFVPAAAVIISGGTPPTPEEKAVLAEHGVRAYLPKPVILTDLGELINRISTEKTDEVQKS